MKVQLLVLLLVCVSCASLVEERAVAPLDQSCAAECPRRSVYISERQAILTNYATASSIVTIRFRITGNAVFVGPPPTGCSYLDAGIVCSVSYWNPFQTLVYLYQIFQTGQYTITVDVGPCTYGPFDPTITTTTTKAATTTTTTTKAPTTTTTTTKAATTTTTTTKAATTTTTTQADTTTTQKATTTTTTPAPTTTTTTTTTTPSATTSSTSTTSTTTTPTTTTSTTSTTSTTTTPTTTTTTTTTPTTTTTSTTTTTTTTSQATTSPGGSCRIYPENDLCAPNAGTCNTTGVCDQPRTECVTTPDQAAQCLVNICNSTTGGCNTISTCPSFFASECLLSRTCVFGNCVQTYNVGASCTNPCYDNPTCDDFGLCRSSTPKADGTDCGPTSACSSQKCASSGSGQFQFSFCNIVNNCPNATNPCDQNFCNTLTGTCVTVTKPCCAAGR